MSITHLKIQVEYNGKQGNYLVKKFQFNNEPPYYYFTAKEGSKRIEIVEGKWKITVGNLLHPDLVKIIGEAIEQAEIDLKNKKEETGGFYPDTIPDEI